MRYPTVPPAAPLTALLTVMTLGCIVWVHQSLIYISWMAPRLEMFQQAATSDIFLNRYWLMIKYDGMEQL